jgi:hypothetical protein
VATGGNRSQIAAIAGVFEGFWHREKGETHGDCGGRGGWTVERWEDKRRALVVHKKVRKFKIVLIVDKVC